MRLFTVPDSTNVRLIGYDHKTAELEVVYHATPRLVYCFQNVGVHAFCDILVADSVGTELARAVKHKGYRKRELAGATETPSPAGPISVTVPSTVVKPAVTPPSVDVPKLTDEEVFNLVTNRPKQR